MRNKDGVLIKAESEYDLTNNGITAFLTNNWIPAIRKTMDLGEAEISKVQIAARPSDDRLNVHENIVYNRLAERALLLDLYTPNGKPTQRLPVVIFVHGGAGFPATIAATDRLR